MIDLFIGKTLLSIEGMICLDILMLLSDAIILYEFKELIYSFLLSKHNKKGAEKIHLAQSAWQRFTLSYIKNETVYPKEYQIFQTMRLSVMLSLIPQYTILILVHLFFRKWLFLCFFILWIIRLILFMILRMQFNSNRISRFDKRYHQ